MAWWKNKIKEGSYSIINDTGLGGVLGNGSSTAAEFYSMEEAIVLDIILDTNHPEIQNQKIKVSSFPDNYKNQTPSSNDLDCTYIGRALVRMVHSQQGMSKNQLLWALPLDVTGIVEYPLLNEVVIVVKYLDNLYYTKKINHRGFINNDADFGLEKYYGMNSGNPITGPLSLTTNKASLNSNYVGGLGNYFLYNNSIRRLKKYEGDTSIESRFGQSIRFAAYDSERMNDQGNYVDYRGDKTINPSTYGGGNPMILIRNRQRKIASDKSQSVHPKLPPIPPISESEKNVGGIIQEDINHDGSSIHITSGLTTSKWTTTVYKSMFADGKEEQPLYSPVQSSQFVYPTLSGDQIVINTDRLILSSRFGETFHYSKKKYGVVTDSEYTVDAHDQVVITTNNKTVINSPAIYLGQYGETNEPAILGQTAVDWLYDLCNWLLDHTHPHNHTHPDNDGGGGGGNVGNADKNITEIPVQQQQLKLLRDNLHKMLSRRVFVTGGGYASGANGIMPKGFNGTTPVTINTANGDGVPGDFKGANRREGPVTKIYS